MVEELLKERKLGEFLNSKGIADVVINNELLAFHFKDIIYNAIEVSTDTAYWV